MGVILGVVSEEFQGGLVNTWDHISTGYPSTDGLPRTTPPPLESEKLWLN